MYSIGVDTGGTFTDFVFYDGENFSIEKVLSTPNNPSLAIIEGLEKHLGELTEISALIHGTTVATNALLEKKGALTCLITTKGFEDVLEIKRQNREELYNLFWNSRPPLVDRKFRVGLTERVSSKGQVLKHIKYEELEEIVDFILENKVESIAVSLLNSYVNSQNEQIISSRLFELKIPYTVSSELVPEFREYERTSTTVINSYLIPKVKEYMNYLGESLEGIDVGVMQSNGGLFSLDQSSREPSKIILSGPAGGVVGAFKISEASGRSKIITYDMGGTSTDISLCNEEISFTTENSVDNYPVKVPMIDISTIGSGGGSIAYIDDGGALKVGPASAGADPGPACYGKGEIPTVTDANLVLGRIDPKMFLGGNMNIFPERSFSAIKSLGIPGLNVFEIAESIIDIVNSNMEKALRLISIGKGFDPREFTLVSFGGAGGLHACELAKSTGINEVLFPLNPGTLSAFGMLVADSFKDYSHTQFYIADKEVLSILDEKFAELEEKARNDLKTDNLVFERYIDARYKRQSHELSLPFTDKLISNFHSLHDRVFGYFRKQDDVEIVTLRLRAYLSKQNIDLPLLNNKTSDVTYGLKKVIFNKIETEFKLFYRKDLYPGYEFDGQSLILDINSTLFIPPQTNSTVDKHGNIITKLNSNSNY